MGRVEIVAWKPEFGGAFRDLNLEWIEEHFTVEEEDRRLLDDPQGAIVDVGGEVVFALLDGRVVGTCALLPADAGELELVKMAVSPDVRGRGVGERVMRGAIEAARRRGAPSLVLETNRVLTPAIRLYEKVGFREVVPTHDSEYARCDLTMRLVL